ncbi:MAG: formylglycine-generating enzyme family protein, partial [Planctomycetaceae bacterium]
MKKLLGLVILIPFMIGTVVTTMESTRRTWSSDSSWSSDPGGSETFASEPDPPPPPTGPNYDLVLEDLGFVRISEGSFPVGSPDMEPGRADGERQRLAFVTDDFFIQPTEMTVSQVQRWLNGNVPSTCSTQPAVGLTWDEAQKVCDALNDYFPDYQFRLPTENEWEYAGRAMCSLPWAVSQADQSDLIDAINKAEAGDDDFLTRFVSRYAHFNAN